MVRKSASMKAMKYSMIFTILIAISMSIPLILILLIGIHTAHIILRGLAIEMLPLATKFDALYDVQNIRCNLI